MQSGQSYRRLYRLVDMLKETSDSDKIKQQWPWSLTSLHSYVRRIGVKKDGKQWYLPSPRKEDHV